MSADNSHADRKRVKRALARCVEMYDQRRAWFRDETEAQTRHVAIDWLARDARLHYIQAAEMLADALAKRAAKREGPC